MSYLPIDKEIKFKFHIYYYWNIFIPLNYDYVVRINNILTVS